MAERYVRAGPLSTKGAGSINFGFYKPQYDYGKQDSNDSSGLSPQSGDNNVAALNKLADPFPRGMPKRTYASGMGGTESDASSMMPETYEDAMQLLKGSVYNPGTKQFESATSSSYPGSTYMPETFNAIDAALLFGDSNASGNIPSNIDTRSVLDNAGNVQASVQQLMYDNPTASVQQVMDAHHENFTGFDSSGNFTGAPVDPGTAAMNAMPDYSQPTQSVFDEGGIFGGGFFNKGGKAGGK